MLQRKQTLWLLVAAIISAGVFYFDLYKANVTLDGSEIVKRVRVNDSFLTLLIALVMTVVPLIAIFMYGNRKKQRMITLSGILANLVFMALVITRANNLADKVSSSGEGSYWIGSILPVVSIVFLIMAVLGINKDEKLVRSSYDRLR